MVIANNPAFILSDPQERERFAKDYRKTSALNYKGQPEFDQLMARLHQHISTEP